MRSVKSLALGLTLVLCVVGVASAELVDIGTHCWQLLTFDDVVILDIKASVSGGEWDGFLTVAMQWDGRDAVTGNLMYSLQGGGTGQRTPDGQSVVLDLAIYKPISHPGELSGNTNQRIAAGFPIASLQGRWGSDGTGGSTPHRGGGAWAPVACPLEVPVVAVQAPELIELTNALSQAMVVELPPTGRLFGMTR